MNYIHIECYKDNNVTIVAVPVRFMEQLKTWIGFEDYWFTFEEPSLLLQLDGSFVVKVLKN